MTTAAELLAAGKAALARGDWTLARSLLSDAVALRESAEGLHELAKAVEWAADYQAAIELYERAFVAYRELGESRRPALIAGRELSFLHAAVYGNDAVAAGWLARARSLVYEAGECVESGWVELAEALATDDPEEKSAHVRAAMDVADRFHAVDLRFCAMSNDGVALVLQGRVDDGMRTLDEAATAAASREVVDYITAGEIYCHMLLCCELTLDVPRARQWSGIATAYGQRSNTPWVSAICRTHYGAVLTAAGEWSDAERELTSSITLFDASYRALRSSAMVRLADLRVRQGRYDEAGRLLAGFEFDSYAVRPLARLHLARGEHAVARRLLRRALERTGEQVSWPIELALLAETEAAAGNVDEAREVCTQLSAVAAGSDVPCFRAFAEYAAGVVCAAADEPEALAHFEAALPRFVRAELPLEAARTRLAISQAIADAEPEVAQAEARAALLVFEELAAGVDADATARHLRTLGVHGRSAPRVAGPLTRREAEVLAHIGEGMTNEQIADRLYISKRTVEHHVSSIFAKLGVATRAAAAAYALRQPPPDTTVASGRSRDGA
ncbi:LuxR C-terminal-related transcriptional regulator [Phytoactinopolyspora endophytica]|uniref:LuxR C-terminal-related transcriptional regulator n=1 Tax=Phytoactinopolyspora endophytica TaxID=1642495 RepID=UPI00101D00FD|nr:LuxR C-terminal-related transcriptional regulator [Phytoactinopolyspora endophytica]